MARQARVKGGESTEGLFADTLTFEREAGTGTRDTTTIHGTLYYRARHWYDDAKGVRKRKTIVARSSAELEKKVKAFLSKPSLQVSAENMTIKQYFTSHFLPGAKATVRPETYASYNNAVKNRIIPGLGSVKMPLLMPDNARAWIAEMKVTTPDAERSNQLAVAILKRGYVRAVDDGMLKANPIGHLKLPKVQMKEQYIMNLKEVIHFLRTVRVSKTDSVWFPLMYCAIALGMREGELLGLVWPKVVWSQSMVNVHQQLGALEDGSLGLVPLKTKASYRHLFLDEGLAEAIRMQQGLDDQMVFPKITRRRTGGFMRCHNVTQNTLPRLLRAADLPDDGRIWFHLLRHVGASLLTQADVATPKIDRWMGHTTPGMHGKYVFVHDEDLQQIAQTMGRILAPVWT